MELFAKIVKGFQLLNNFVKQSFLDLWLGTDCTSGSCEFGKKIDLKRSNNEKDKSIPKVLSWDWHF